MSATGSTSSAPRCPRCQGTLLRGQDTYGAYRSCILCRYQDERPAPRAWTVPHTASTAALEAPTGWTWERPSGPRRDKDSTTSTST